MQFTPITKEEADKKTFQVLPKGIYDFEILSADEKVSKKGNPMIETKVRVFANDGSSTNVFDYLMESMAFKLRHCAEACGLIEYYNDGKLNPDHLVGCTGKLKLDIEVPTGYPERNVIKDYVVEGEKAAAPKKSPSAALNDELPEW